MLQIVTSVIISAGDTSISSWAFDGYAVLASVTIANSVTSIGSHAFYACTSLTSIIFEGTVQQWQAITKGHGWDSNTGDYTIYCTDGTITKDGTIRCYEHSWSDWYETTVHSCTLDGLARRDCTKCDHYETNILEKLGHDYEAVVTEPTWESGGYTTHTCVNCGGSYVDSYTDPLPYIPGDADGNGTVNTDDAIYLLYNVMFGDGDYPVTQECDFDGNGTVNTDDAIYLLYHVMFGEEDYPLH